MPLLGNAVISKNFLRTRKNHLGDAKQREGRVLSTYPHRPKAEVFSNAVDVVELLHDPTGPSTERTAPPCSAHVQLNDVPRGLDPVEGRGRVPSARRRGDGVGDVIRADLRLSTTTT